MHQKTITTLIHFSFVFLGYFSLSSQSNLAVTELEVNKVYEPLSLSKEAVQSAKELKDLNKIFKPSDVKQYISLEITTLEGGQIVQNKSKDGILSIDQKRQLINADDGSKIYVDLLYMPDNNLTHNDPKRFDFSFIVHPDYSANFPGGENALREYFDESVLSQLSDSTFTGYDLAAITFSIDEEGGISDPKIFWSSNQEKVDQLLLQAVCDMPKWSPARYANNTKTKESHALTVGNHQNCALNMLNLRRE